MTTAFNIGLSGLLAASTRVQIASNNIVNAGSTTQIDDFPDPSLTLERNAAFQPLRTQNTALEGGGVQARGVPIQPATIPVFDASSPDANAGGIVGFPNVSLAEEIVQLKLAEAAYKASVTVLRTADEVTKSLLDATRSRA